MYKLVNVPWSNKTQSKNPFNVYLFVIPILQNPKAYGNGIRTNFLLRNMKNILAYILIIVC